MQMIENQKHIWWVALISLLVLLFALFPAPMYIGKMQYMRPYYAVVIFAAVSVFVAFGRRPFRPLSVLLPNFLAASLSAYQLYTHMHCGGMDWCNLY
jgi:hypothetical protein